MRAPARVAVLAATLLSLAAASTAATGPATAVGQATRVAAHRGGAGLWPEKSIWS